MKKTTMKKLVLNRETLIHLKDDLTKVGGGYTARCQYSGYATCLTCEATCTTNYC